MNTFTSIAVRVHNQDNDSWCGPACIQMISGALGSSPLPTQQSIAAAYGMDGARGQPWIATPQRVAAALNGLGCRPKETRGAWRVAHYHREEQLLADLALAMKRFGTPAMVTDGSADHWQVVTAIEVTPQVHIQISLRDPDVYREKYTQRIHDDNDACLGRIVSREDAWDQFNARIDPVKGHHNASGYDGLAVGIVFGNPPTAENLARWTAIMMTADKRSVRRPPQLIS